MKNKKISFDDEHVKISDLLKTNFTETTITNKEIKNIPVIDHELQK